jgi:hypothetical protein
MLQVVALVFQGVEGLVLNFPTSPPGPHQVVSVLGGEDEIGDPGKALGGFGSHLPVFQDVHFEMLVGLIEGATVKIAEIMELLRISRVLKHKLADLAFLYGLIELLKKELVVSGLDSQDEAQVKPHERFNMGSVGAEGVLRDDDF